MKKRTVAYALLTVLLLVGAGALVAGIIAIWSKSPPAAIAVALVAPVGIGLAELISWLAHAEGEH